ncbi:MAG: competence/damage-inducible protein A [Acidimicrobiia bacterium]|nr:competence/damage-inducible protein A [Acidimicrobiia bacterium]MCY4457428.1 competence/damage-inducible protein A [Acidimicrobiaceae bacterium]
MNCEVVAVGSELLLGQITDTNSVWIGEQLALAGIDSHYQTKVGDNPDRIVSVLELALKRSDAVIVCGGLGPTQDDITRAAIAAVMGVELVRDPQVLSAIEAKFRARNRSMPSNNERQAEIPQGARVIPVIPGTAAGLICPINNAKGEKVIYAVPGVPWEMREMMHQGVLPDLHRRAASGAVIRSRVLRTWGLSESSLAEQLDKEIRRLDQSKAATIAFLASGIEGLKVRITAKADNETAALKILDDEAARLEALLGSIVFGTDDDTMESVVLAQLRAQNRTLALAESFTGGLIASRIVGVAGCSDVFRGAVVPYHLDLKQSLLGVQERQVVSERMVIEMAAGACRSLNADVGLATSGVAGPEPHDNTEVGVLCIGVCIDDFAEAITVKLPFDRERIRQFGCITALDLLRNRLKRRCV